MHKKEGLRKPERGGIIENHVKRIPSRFGCGVHRLATDSNVSHALRGGCKVRHPAGGFPPFFHFQESPDLYNNYGKARKHGY